VALGVIMNINEVTKISLKENEMLIMRFTEDWSTCSVEEIMRKIPIDIKKRVLIFISDKPVEMTKIVKASK
jgi:hypothetical protein